ncbi:MAG: hypothetical protein ACRCX8_04515 [Sarcina sp.]
MFTTKLKTTAYEKLEQNTETKYSPGIFLYLIPAFVQFYITLRFGASDSIISTLIELVIFLIVMYLSLYLQVFTTKVLTKKTSIADARPDKKLVINYMVPIVLEYIVATIIVTYILKNNAIGTSIVSIFSMLFQLFMELYVVAYVLFNGKVKIGAMFRALPELFWRFVVLSITFIPLLFLIGITFGILGFWKITYIMTSYRALVVSMYVRYQKDTSKPFIKPLIVSIIIIIGLGALLSLNGSIGNQVTAQNVYKITAYNGQEYDFVTENNNIVSVRFPDGLNLQQHLDGTAMPLVFNGKNSPISVVFAPDGRFMGIEEVNDPSKLQGITSIDKVKAGALSVNEGYGFSF